MIWMEKFIAFMAFLHTIKTVLIMIDDRLQHHNHKYILLSKFRTDNSKGCFGLYKQRSECNYLVSIKDVMHNEMKLKSNGLVRLCIASKGMLTVSDIIASLSDNKTEKQDSSFIEYFPY